MEYKIAERNDNFIVYGLWERRHHVSGDILRDWLLIDAYGKLWEKVGDLPPPPIAEFETIEAAKWFIKMMKINKLNN